MFVLHKQTFVGGCACVYIYIGLVISYKQGWCTRIRMPWYDLMSATSHEMKIQSSLADAYWCCFSLTPWTKGLNIAWWSTKDDDHKCVRRPAVGHERHHLAWASSACFHLCLVVKSGKSFLSKSYHMRAPFIQPLDLQCWSPLDSLQLWVLRTRQLIDDRGYLGWPVEGSEIGYVMWFQSWPVEAPMSYSLSLDFF